jgi:predicted outer membrane protein
MVATAAALLCAGAVRAETEAEYQEPSPANPKPAPAVRLPAFAPGAAALVRRLTAQEREERAFLRQAAAANRFHADAARLVMVKSSDPTLRALALSLLDERALIGNELLRLLHQRGMAAPMLENTHRNTLNRLGRVQPRRFDREFLEALAPSLQQEADSYERASVALEDPAVHAWVAGKVPTLRSDIAAVQRLASPQAAVRTPRAGVRSVRPAAGRPAAVAVHP